MNLTEIKASEYDKFVGLLTPIQKDQLVGQAIRTQQLFKPCLRWQ